MLLEAHRWTGKAAYEDGIVDAIAPPDEMYNVAFALAEKWAPKAKAGVFGVLREELYGEALATFRSISYVHSKKTSREAISKI